MFNEETRILKQQTNLIYIYQVNISKIIVINSTFSQQSRSTNSLIPVSKVRVELIKNVGKLKNLIILFFKSILHPRENVVLFNLYNVRYWMHAIYLFG